MAITSPETTGAGAAREAGLRYTSDDMPGITRHRAGRGFSYRRPGGTLIRDARTLRRLRSLAVPPAWTDVWICNDPRGHLQATGRDARGRKQHRYHPEFRRAREAAKYGRLLEFARVLPAIRERVDADLARPGLPREKVLAAVVRLLELSLIRVGNEEYARLNRSFGLTTLQDRHARIESSHVRFRFTGKSGRRHEVALRDRRLARVVSRCQELPGQDLFQYVDVDGEVRDVRSEDVNDYLRQIAPDISAKDFRTWAGTVLAYRALRAMQLQNGTSRRAVVEAMKATAERLGNTHTVTRASYVHPAVVEAYLGGRVPDALVEVAEGQEHPPAEATMDEEAALTEILEERLELDAARATDRPRRGRSKRVAASRRVRR